MNQAKWYVQKGSRVQGPFADAEIRRFMELGRIRGTDKVSDNGELWEPISQVPELVPESILPATTMSLKLFVNMGGGKNVEGLG